MKAGQVNKLYSKLTPLELATLAFEANANGDNQGFEAINSALPLLSYTAPHYDYRRRTYGLVCLAFYYRGEYYQALFKKVLGMSTHDTKQNLEYSAKLAAMDAALNQVCEQINVDVETVKKTACCCADSLIIDHCSIQDEVKHNELVKEYLDVFIQIVS